VGLLLRILNHRLRGGEEKIPGVKEQLSAVSFFERKWAGIEG
jgi:hypothetical protein